MNRLVSHRVRAGQRTRAWRVSSAFLVVSLVALVVVIGVALDLLSKAFQVD